MSLENEEEDAQERDRRTIYMRIEVEHVEEIGQTWSELVDWLLLAETDGEDLC